MRAESTLLTGSSQGFLLRPHFDVAVLGTHLGVRVQAQPDAKKGEEPSVGASSANLPVGTASRVDGIRRAP